MFNLKMILESVFFVIIKISQRYNYLNNFWFSQDCGLKNLIV